jgi:CBS domain containing-hemolysin-like protein
VARLVMQESAQAFTSEERMMINRVLDLQTLTVRQAVGIRRKVSPHELGLLVHDVVNETGILVGEAVVVLPPDMRGQKVV